jgi:aminopeptidase N
VRDIAVSLTRESRWDAARTPVGDRDGDGDPDHARIDALWRASAMRWQRAADFGAHAIEFLSRWTAVPYPWPHMTLVEGGGIIGGGMEFPMLTLIGDYTRAGDTALYNVIAHELAHMWVPMIAGTDESRYAWMDEGTTTFNENQARGDIFPGQDHGLADLESYVELAQSGHEGEVMRRSNFHYTSAQYGIASYSKPATLLRALRGVLGDSTFTAGLREYLTRWRYRHPTPWDMFATFEDVAGRDLEWFWRTWYYETWTLDQAIASVTPGAGGTRIVIEDRGLAPMPVRLAIRYADGRVERREIPVDVWLGGATSTAVTVDGTVQAVAIDPERLFPDVDPSNNRWAAGR